MGKYLTQILPNIDTDWTKWTIFFCDERYVPDNDVESTFGYEPAGTSKVFALSSLIILIILCRFYKSNLIPKVPLTAKQFVSINVNDPLEKVTKDYEAAIREKFRKPSGFPSFDLLLLGVGPDGHTASLFPGHKLLEVGGDQLIASISDSPKPPPERITMTMNLINNARYAIFAVPGSGKAEIIKKIFLEKEDLPAAKVKPIEKVYWLLDLQSAVHVIDEIN